MYTGIAPEAPCEVILPEATDSNQSGIGQKETMEMWLSPTKFQ